MHVALVGLNHRTAPVALRERLAVSGETLQALLHAPLANGLASPVERAVLSTCNRFEFYLALPDPAQARTAFHNLVGKVHPIPGGDLDAHLYEHVDEGTARHLFRVACGLDSMVLGESQILGQVAEAYEAARAAGATGPLLSRLFQEAVRVGKRARAETTIGHGHASVGSAAVHLLHAQHPDLPDRRVLVIGAGTMGRIVARHLQALGTRHLAILNRTLERARVLARDVGGTPHPWEALRDRLCWADVVIVATAAQRYILHPQEVVWAMSSRPRRPLTIADVGVPRNVHPEVARVEGVSLVDIDALREVVEEGMIRRRRAIPEVEALVEQAVRGFCHWLRARAVAPTISALYAHAEAIRQRELARALRHFPQMDAAERAALDTLTRSLIDKLLQTPAQRLRALAVEGQVHQHDVVLRELFGLSEGP